MRATASSVRASHRRRLKLIAMHVVTEINSARRSVEYIVGLIVVPALLYAMFGLPNDSTWVGGESPYSTIAIASMAAYGVVSLAIFTFADDISKERARGWITTMRATPIPLWSHLIAKLIMAGLYALAIIVLLATVSIPTGASQLSVGAWLAIAALAVVGTWSVGTVGIAVAFSIRPRAATAIANLVFLPLAFCSGFFFPLSELPAFLREVAPWLPTYHLGRLMWSATASPAEIDALTGIHGQAAWVHAVWLAGLAAAGLAASWLALGPNRHRPRRSGAGQVGGKFVNETDHPAGGVR